MRSLSRDRLVEDDQNRQRGLSGSVTWRCMKPTQARSLPGSELLCFSDHTEHAMVPRICHHDVAKCVLSESYRVIEFSR